MIFVFEEVEVVSSSFFIMPLIFINLRKAQIIVDFFI